MTAIMVCVGCGGTNLKTIDVSYCENTGTLCGSPAWGREAACDCPQCKHERSEEEKFQARIGQLKRAANRLGTSGGRNEQSNTD